MAIYLAQHGKNLPKDVDPDKGLSGEGREDVERVASAARKYGLEVDVIKHSGKKRARETAEILAASLNPPQGVLAISGLGPLDDVANLAAAMAAQEDVIFVGHLPFMERLVSYLVGGTPERPVLKFQNGGMVCLDKEGTDREWMIRWMLVPNIV